MENTLFRELIGKARRCAANSLSESKLKYGRYAYGVIAEALAVEGDVDTAIDLMKKYVDPEEEFALALVLICAQKGNLESAMKVVQKVDIFDRIGVRCEALAIIVQTFAAHEDLLTAGQVAEMIPTRDVTSYCQLQYINAHAAIVAKTKSKSDLSKLIEKADTIDFWALKARAYAAIAKAVASW